MVAIEYKQQPIYTVNLNIITIDEKWEKEIVQLCSLRTRNPSLPPCLESYCTF
jgi:hypothetical protein